MTSEGARNAMNRAGPQHIKDLTPTSSVVKTSLSAHEGALLYFTARTATVHVNFGETSAVTATTTMFAIEAGQTQEFKITVYRKWIAAIAGSTATLGIGTTSL